MTVSDEVSTGTQRLFQHPSGTQVLLSKAGGAVSFWVDEEGRVHVVERLDGVDFKATGTQLKQEGWTCVGPGVEYGYLLEKA